MNKTLHHNILSRIRCFINTMPRIGRFSNFLPRIRTFITMRNIVYLFPLVFLSLFFYYPISSILENGLFRDGSFTGQYIMKILESKYYRRVIFFTIKQAFLSAIVTLLIGLPAAYLLSKHSFPGKSAVRALLTIPFVLPTIIVAIGFILLFGRNGLVNDFLAITIGRQKLLYNLYAIVLAHVFFNIAIVIRLVGASWSGIDTRAEEAAESLGASPWKRFFFVTLPMLTPAILASFILTFMYCFMSFTIVLVLGDPSLTTMEVTIYSLNSVLTEYELASAMAIIQIIFTLIFLYVYMVISDRIPGTTHDPPPMAKKKIQRIQTRSQSPSPRHTLRSIFTARKVLIAIYIAFITLAIIGPMLEVVRYSFIYNDSGEDVYSFHWWRSVWDSNDTPAGISPLDAIINTLFFAFMTVMISVPLGTTIAYFLGRTSFKGKRAMSVLFMLPLGISAITLSLGLIRGYSSGTLILNHTWYGIVIAHSILAYPFVMRSVSASLKHLNPHLTEAAMSLGADRTVSFFRIELPLILPGIIVGAIFAFSISVGELGATYMLYKPEYATLPMVIYRYIGSRDFGMGIVLSVILMLIVFFAFILIEKMGKETGF